MKNSILLPLVALTLTLWSCSEQIDSDEGKIGLYYSPDVGAFFSITSSEQRIFGEESNVEKCHYSSLVYCDEGQLSLYLPRYPVHFGSYENDEGDLPVTVVFSAPTFLFCDQLVVSVIVRMGEEVITYVFDRYRGLVGFNYSPGSEGKLHFSAYLVGESDINYFSLLCDVKNLSD